MKRNVTLLVVCAALAAGLSAQTPEPADPTAEPIAAALEPIDFSISLKDLHLAAASGDDRGIPGGRTLIIDAEIGAITVVVDDDTGFLAEVELVGGSWISESAVELYRAYAVFDGAQFRPLFSRRSAERRQAGDKLLLLSRYMGLTVDYDGLTPVSVIEAIDVRILP